uniref:Helitron helicase n=1 Tax=Caenorhabditis tropicalis TaxID=1561998 RepID=A0A1I7TDP8_9PELO
MKEKKEGENDDCVRFRIVFYEEVDNQYDPEKQSSRDVIVKYVYYLSNPQKESLITVTSVGTVLAATPITYAYNNMGFR